MAIRINYNPMSVFTHANLNRADRAMSQVLERLSSGERLQRSADDPAGLVIANAVRFHRAGVNQARANAEEAVTVLQTAEGGMEQIAEVLRRLRALAVAALNQATADPAQLAALQQELDNGVRSITTIADGTTYAGSPLLSGALKDITLSAEAQKRYHSLRPDWTKLPGGIQDGSQLTIGPASGTLSKPQVTHAFAPNTPPSAAATTSSGTLTVSGPLGSVALSIAAGTSIQAVVSLINANRGITGVAAAYDQATGALRVESTHYGNSPLSLTSAGLGGLLAGPVIPAVNRTLTVSFIDGAGNPQTVTLTQDPASPGGLEFVNLGGGPEAAPPYSVYTPGALRLRLRDTSDGSVGSTIAPAPAPVTASRIGTTAFQTGALASQRVVLELPDLRAGALGHSAGLAGSGFASLADLVSDPTGVPPYAGAFLAGDANTALQLIDAALAEVNRARGAAGALQGNTIERVLDALQVSSINLHAFEGVLRDADMAREAAEYARVQVLMQAATAMLAQANQVPQRMLELLR